MSIFQALEQKIWNDQGLLSLAFAYFSQPHESIQDYSSNQRETKLLKDKISWLLLKTWVQVENQDISGFTSEASSDREEEEMTQKQKNLIFLS